MSPTPLHRPERPRNAAQRVRAWRRARRRWWWRLLRPSRWFGGGAFD